MNLKLPLLAALSLVPLTLLAPAATALPPECAMDVGSLLGDADGAPVCPECWDGMRGILISTPAGDVCIKCPRDTPSSLA